MKPSQPRLLRESRSARRWVAAAGGAGLAGAALTIAIAILLSRVLAGAVQGRETFAGAAVPLLLIAGLAAARGLLMSAAEYAGHLAARDVIAALRSRLLHALADAGPAALEGERSGAIATAATTGIEALDTYFARYLPQLVLGTVVPVMVLTYLAINDLLSAAVVAVTLPLIPLFMWLVGAAAQHRMNQRWALLQRLGAYFLDVVQGLPTLRIFGRADAQVERVRTVTEAARKATMGTLALAFLSSFVLETLASIATALVAAEIGLRLVDGSMTLQTGLLVLIVVPEAYMPLRQIGTFFHASTEGISAATTVLDLAESAAGSDLAPPAVTPAPDLAFTPIAFSGVTRVHGERGEGITAPLTFTLRPGTTTLLTGASGAGKTTLLDLLVPFAHPTSGAIRAGGLDLREIDLDTWRSQVGWVPQHPSLFAGTVLENLLLGSNLAIDDVPMNGTGPVAARFIVPASSEGYGHDKSCSYRTSSRPSSIADIGPSVLLHRLFPDRTLALETPLTADGEGLSGGERMRLALARALLRRPSLLLLDEPTAFLDPRSALAVVAVLQEVAASTTLIIATHEPERFPWADQVVDLDSGEIRVSASPACAGEQIVAWRATS